MDVYWVTYAGDMCPQVSKTTRTTPRRWRWTTTALVSESAPPKWRATSSVLKASTARTLWDCASCPTSSASPPSGSWASPGKWCSRRGPSPGRTPAVPRPGATPPSSARAPRWLLWRRPHRLRTTTPNTTLKITPQTLVNRNPTGLGEARRWPIKTILENILNGVPIKIFIFNVQLQIVINSLKTLYQYWCNLKNNDSVQ